MNQAPAHQPMTPERKHEYFLTSMLTAGFSGPTQRWAHVKADDFALYIPSYGDRTPNDIGPAPHGGPNAQLTLREKTTGTSYTVSLDDIAAALGMTPDTRAAVLTWDQYATRPRLDPDTADQVIQIAALGRVAHH